MKLSRQTILSAVALMLWASTAALAIPINGTFDIAGGSDATVMATSLLFNCTPGSLTLAPCPGPANSGNFHETTGTGSFAPYVTQGGYIQNLSQGTTPINQNFLLSNWITFSGTAGNPVLPPDIALDLRFIFTGVSGQAACGAAPSPGQICTPIIPALITPANPSGLSPYNLQNIGGGGSTASFGLSGTARRLSTGEVSNFNGTFTAQFSTPYQDVLTQLFTTGAVSNSYSATFTVTAIPEPATESLAIGAILILAGLGLRKKFVRL
jgi:hypothetical protein